MQYGRELGQQLLMLLGETAVLGQLVILLVLLLLARLATWKLEPQLETRIRAIESPDRRRLRPFAILLRRLGWALFVLFGSLALALMQLTHWPASTYLISTSVVLALAWLVIRLADNKGAGPAAVAVGHPRQFPREAAAAIGRPHSLTAGSSGGKSRCAG
jgi:small-conductance mechanosensitive channel